MCSRKRFLCREVTRDQSSTFGVKFELCLLTGYIDESFVNRFRETLLKEFYLEHTARFQKFLWAKNSHSQNK